MRHDMCSFGMRILSFVRVGLIVAILLPLVGGSNGFAQGSLPRAGRQFTFGVIEGAENLPGADQSSASVILTVLSLYDGCGTITSPSGYAQDFSFSAMRATVISIPTNLVHSHDLGKTNKGLIVRTNEPVSLTLHDFILEAGDATQLYPDDALDTNYMVAEWGTWDDLVSRDTIKLVFEPNHCEILVTAPQDNTVVTITPTVLTMLNQPKNVPFTVTLNAGECYIVKADSNGRPLRTSLANSTVVSSKPVSVIVGTTCAYVPLTVESCNEIMDEIVGKSHWSNHFYIAPLGNADTSGDVRAMLTSDQPFSFTVSGAGGFAPGRIELAFKGAAEIITSVPVELHELAEGSWIGGNSDPTLVTVLDSTLWADTLLWNAPSFNGAFVHWASIIYPTAAFGAIRLDNQPLSSLTGSGAKIAGSNISTFLTSIPDGVHILTSPVPIFAIAAGFQSADAYSFLPGTVATRIPLNTIKHTLNILLDTAMACHDFGATFTVAPPFTAQEGVMSLTITIAYDSLVTSFVRFEKHLGIENAFISIDSTRLGYLTITIIGRPTIIGSDLFRIVFHGEKTAVLALLNPGASVCADAVEEIVTTPAQFAVLASTDTLRHALVFDSTAAILCKPLVLHLLTDSILAPGELFVPTKIEITFDTALFTFTSLTPGVLLRKLPMKTTGGTTGDIVLTIDTIAMRNGSDSLLTLALMPRTSGANTVIHAHLTYLVCDELHTKDVTLQLAVTPNVDTTTTTLGIMTAPVSFGNQASATIMLNGLPLAATVTQFLLFVTYNHGVISCTGTGTQGTLTAGWTYLLHPGATTDTLIFSATSGQLGISGTLTNLLFKTFVADSTSSPIAVRSTLPAHLTSGCEVIYQSLTTSTNFAGMDLCGDSLLRGFMRTGSLIIERAEQSFSTLDLKFKVPYAEDVTISLSDVLGHEVARDVLHSSSGEQSVQLPLGPAPSGAYLLRVEGPGGRATRKVVVLR